MKNKEIKDFILNRIQSHIDDIRMYEQKLKESETLFDSKYYINNVEPLIIKKSELEMILKYCF
jgi:hypothetical protein